jgi:hypothetical protein
MAQAQGAAARTESGMKLQWTSLLGVAALAIATGLTAVSTAKAGGVRARLPEDQVADYIIGKIMDNFQYRGRVKIGEWRVEEPRISYTHPVFEIAFRKRIFDPAALPESFDVDFRIDMRAVKYIAISRGILHVDCFTPCVDVTSNGQSGHYSYFWINNVAVSNFLEASRINSAFLDLKAYNPTPIDPYIDARVGRRR